MKQRVVSGSAQRNPTGGRDASEAQVRLDLSGGVGIIRLRRALPDRWCSEESHDRPRLLRLQPDIQPRLS